jgi:hypothetical protein
MIRNQFLVLALALAGVTSFAETLYNGIVLPSPWPPAKDPTQTYALPTYITNPPAVIPIDTGRQLFVDDFLIESTTLTRKEHRPVMHPGNPVLAPDGVVDPNASIPFSDGVWYDPSDSVFKMWYYGGNGTRLSYATSTDGIGWTRPSLQGGAFPGTNQVTQIRSGRDSATVWLDQDEPNPARRFKLFYYYTEAALEPPARIFYRFSPDGITWGPDQPNSFVSLSDRTTVFWNPFRRKWVDSIRLRWILPDAPTRSTYYSRVRFYTESSDLINWSPVTFWTGPDERDPIYGSPTDAPPELYNLDAVGYESLIVGLFSWYHPGPPNETAKTGQNVVELTAGFSRDGFQWVRPTRGYGPTAFIPASNTPGTWNGYNTQSAGGCFLIIGEELWFYFSGRTEKKPANGIMATGLAKLRRDGFYSMDAGTSEGTLTTRRLTFNGRRLFVNLDAAGGELQAEILDANGNVLQPYSKANSVPARINTTLHEMRWSGVTDLTALRGRTLKIRFYLRNGSLYSFWVSADAQGSSGGYVAAGGPRYTGPIDTLGAAALPPAVDAPVASPSGGTFRSPIQIRLTTPTAGAEIRYTINGSDPTESSARYTGPFTLSRSSTVRARAYKAGLAPSPVTGHSFSFGPRTASFGPQNGVGASALFTAQFDDPDGFADLEILNILINRALDGRQACYLAYLRSTNTVYVLDDPGTTLVQPGVTVSGGSGSTSNSYCTISAQGSSASGSGNRLTLTLNIVFNTTQFAFDQIVYVAARDRNGGNSGWSTGGLWRVPPAAPEVLSVASYSPVSGSGSAPLLTMVVRHSGGAGNITNAQVLINSDLNGGNACYLGYYAPGNLLFLVADGGLGAPLLGPITPGSGTAQLENSQCRVSAEGSSATLSGTDLTLQFNVSFKPGFSGLKITHAAAQNFNPGKNENTGWRAVSLWTVQ